MKRFAVRSLFVLAALAPLSAPGIARSAAPAAQDDAFGDLLSAANQEFYVGQGTTAISPITFTCSGFDINTFGNLHVIIPPTLDMEWDTTDTVASMSPITLGGGSAGTAAVSPIVSYFNAKTLKITITGNFSPLDNFTMSGLSFRNFNSPSAFRLFMSKNNSPTYDPHPPFGAGFNVSDDRTITIRGNGTQSSISNQTFFVGNNATGASSIVLTDSATVGGFDDVNDIRIRIPSTYSMTFDTSDTTIGVSGTAAAIAKVSATVSYPDTKTMLVDITADFTANQTVTISGFSFANFTVAEVADNLEMSVNGGVSFPASCNNDKTIQTVANPTISMSTQTFTVGDPATTCNTITITENATAAQINWIPGIEIRIPAGLGVTWDTTDTTVTFGGSAAAKMGGVSFPDNKTCFLTVAFPQAFATSDTLTVAGLTFAGFTAATTGISLELDTDSDSQSEDVTGATVQVGGPVIQSFPADVQGFNVGDDSTTCGQFYIWDNFGIARINSTNDIRVKIPSALNMVWDTTASTPTFSGPAFDNGRVVATVTFEDVNKTAVIHVNGNWVLGEFIYVNNLKFRNFNTASVGAHGLELEVNNANTSCDTDDTGKQIGGAPTITLSTNPNVYTVGDAAVVAPTVTITDGSGVGMINLTSDIRVTLPAGMSWNTSDTTTNAHTGTGAARASTTVTYADGGRTLIIDVTSDFATTGGMTLGVSGLSWFPFTASAAAQGVTLEVDGDPAVEATSVQTVAVGGPTISSQDNQGFNVGDGATLISPITIAEDGATARIKLGTDIRIKIPSAYNMTWDTSDNQVSLGGTASGRVGTTVTFEDSNRTLVLDVVTDFGATENLTISGLSFIGFGTTSPQDRLELEVNNANTNCDEDDKTIQIGGAPSMTTTGQSFTVGDPATAMQTLTITDGSGVAMINTTNHIRIKLPGASMTWLTSDTTASFPGGTAAGKVSATVIYEDLNRTVVISVTAPFVAGDTLQVSGLSYTSFTGALVPAGLALEVDGDGTAEATTLATVGIGAPTISSAGNQTFNVGDASTLISRITYAENTVARALSGGTIRIRIPTGMNMVWDASDTTASYPTGASGKVSATVSFADLNKTLVIPVTTNFLATDTLGIEGLSFTTFSGTSAADNLELIMTTVPSTTVADDDDKTKQIGGVPTISSANQSFTVGDPSTGIAAIIVTDASGVAKINTTQGIRVVIPALFPMTWDTSDTTATYTAGVTGKVSATVSYPDSKTLLIPVTTNWSPSDSLTITGLSFMNFSAASGGFDNLELEVDGDPAPEAVALETIGVGVVTMTLASSPRYTVNDPAAAIPLITIQDDAFVPRIKDATNIRVKLGALNMTWDSLDTTATLGGATGRIGTLAYEESGKTLLVNVTSDFLATESLTIQALSFQSFSAASTPVGLTLELDLDGTAEATTLATVGIGAPTISSAGNQTFNVGDASTLISRITYAENTVARALSGGTIRIRIPTGMNMVWDASDTTASYPTGASGKVSATVSFADLNKTLVIPVTTNFLATDTLGIEGLSFTTFSGTSAADNLELIMTTVPSTTVADDDDKTKQIGGVPTISSANQSFTVGDPSTGIAAIIVTDASGVAKINTTQGIRVVIPALFPMTWDTSDTTATYTAGVTGKVSATVSYPDSKTLLIPVTTNWSPSDSLTITGLSFMNFSAASGGFDNLELEVDGDPAPEAVALETIGVGAVTMTSGANQTFTFNDPITTNAQITIQDDAFVPRIKAGTNIRVKIPGAFPMTWNTGDTTATFGGASGRAGVVSYEDSGRTLLIDVTSDFLATESLTIDNLGFTAFSGAAGSANMTLELDNDPTAEAVDPFAKAIGAPTISSAGNQTFNVGDASTPISPITYQENTAARAINGGSIRIRIPAGMNMVWDATDTTASYTAGATGKVNTLVSFTDLNKTLVIPVTGTFLPAEFVTISGLSFTTFSGTSASDNLELIMTTVPSTTVADDDDKTKLIGGQVAISSTANQAFTVGDGSTGISAITVTDASAVARINTTQGIRVVIPAAFPMTWDTSDTTAAFAGSAALKASTTVSFPDAKTLQIAVTTNFDPVDTLQISGLSFMNFSAASGGLDNLEVDVDADAASEAIDDKTIGVGAPALASAANRTFTVNDPPTSVTASLNTLVVTDDGFVPRVKAANELRIKIPVGVLMTWDTSDTTATLTGSGAVNCQNIVAFEDGGKTLRILVDADFSAGQTLSVDGLSFANFSGGSAGLSLTLELDGDSGAEATDLRTAAIGAPTILSDANQTFATFDLPTLMSPLTYTETSVPRATTASGIRVRIPAGMNMLWDTSDTTAVFGGSAMLKASTTVAFADAGKTLVITVGTSFAALDTLQISGLSFTTFSAESAADGLELILTTVPSITVADEDDRTKQIGGQPTLSSFASQSFTINDPITAAGDLTITDAVGVAKITAAGDLRVRIPASLNLTWNTAILSVTVTPSGTGTVSATVTYPDAKTLLLDVTVPFDPSDSVLIQGLQFTAFSAASAPASLTLDVNNDGLTDATDDKTRAVGAPTLSSASSQIFLQGGGAAPASVLTVTDGLTPRIKLGTDIRIRIPASLDMVWDTTASVVTFGGATGKVVNPLTFEDGDKTLIVDVTADFAAGEVLTITGAAFRNFNTAGAPAFLELETSAADTVADLDNQTKAIQGALSLVSDANQAFAVNDPSTPMELITITDAAGVPTINTTNDIRIKIPAAFPMTWNTTLTIATFGGVSGKVSNPVSYADGGRTLVIPVTTNFAAGDVLTVDNLAFTNFSAAAAASALTLETDGDGSAEAVDTRSIAVGAPTISSFSSQVFASGGPSTAASLITITDGAVPRIVPAKEIRIRIPAGLDMVWDTTASIATFGGATGKVLNPLTFEDGDKTLVVNVTNPFTTGEVLTIDGAAFRFFGAASAGASLELEISDADTVADLDDKTKAIQGAQSIVSAANQIFTVNDPSTPAQTITITDSAGVSGIRATTDLRVKIPAGFGMTWNTGVASATFGGSGAGKVTNPLTFEDGGRTLVVNVTSDFTPGDVLTLADVEFFNFTTQGTSNLTLETDGDLAAEATDSASIAIGAPTISSALGQSFNTGDPATAISVITLTPGTPSRLTAGQIRIRIPATLNMTWDPSDTTAAFGGTGGVRANNPVAFADANKTLVITLASSLLTTETLTVGGLAFANFGAESGPDGLELIVTTSPSTTVAAEDDKTIQVGGQLTLSSAAHQVFTVGDATTPIAMITIADAPGIAKINTTNGIRVKIPAGFNMTWDAGDAAATFGGSAALKVGAISYENSDRTLAIAVTSPFAPGDTLTIADLGFENFSAASAAANLTLEVDLDGTPEATDDKTIAVGAPTISSAANQAFTVNDPSTPIAVITVAEDGATPRVKDAMNLRVKIPAAFPMTWNTALVSATFGGSAAGKVTNPVGYEDGGKTLVVSVTADFAATDVLTIADLAFLNFTAQAATANLTLELDGDAGAEDADDKTLAIGAPTLSSAGIQTFNVGDPATGMSQITVTDGAPARITPAGGIRIRIPAGFGMTWDATDTTAAFGGAVAKVSNPVAFEDGNQTLVVTVLAPFANGETLTIAGLSFTGFAQSPSDNLELEVNNLNTNCDLDDKTIQVGGQLTLSSAGNQAFTAGDATTPIAMITITDAPGIAKINTTSGIRVKIPAGFNMTWDAGDAAATFGGSAALKVGAISYENSDRTLAIAVTSPFAPGDTLTIADLGFENFTGSSAPANLTLEVDLDGTPEATDDKTIAVGAVTLASAANQVFTVNDPPRTIAVITIQDDAATPRVKDAMDLRVKIPAAFPMTWNTALVSATFGGSAAGKVANPVAYEDGGKTLVVSVGADFVAGDALTIADLAFMSFTAQAPAVSLTLEIDADPAAEATDTRTIAIGAPTISSAADQGFNLGNPATPISPITITDGSSARILMASDLRVRVPAAIGMTWDVSDTTATFGGTAMLKASPTVTYADGGKTLIIDVTADFVAGDTLIVSDLAFASFTVVSGPDNLALDTSGLGTVADLDDKTVRVGGLPLISSAASQAFTVGDPVTPIQTLTITDAAGVAMIRDAFNLRVKIPPGFNMTWDTTDTTATFTGATAKVGAVSYADLGRTLVVEITSDFAPGEVLTIAGLSFTAFSGASPPSALTLEVDGDPTAEATDDKSIAIGAPTLSSASSQIFAIGDPTTAASDLSVADGPVARITAANDIRVRIPAGLGMTWDTTDTTAVLGGTGAVNASTTVSYEDAGKTLVVDVTGDFAGGDFLVISGVSFTAFSAPSAGANLELEINNADTVAAVDDKQKAIRSAPTLSSAADQAFTRGDDPTAAAAFTVTDAGGVPLIRASQDIRVRIPAAANLTWDTTDTTIVVNGSAAGSVASIVSYEDAGLTLVINVTSDFAASDTLGVSGLSFRDFSASSAGQRLNLDLDGSAPGEAVDDKTLAVGAPTISSAAGQGFGAGDPPQAAAAITITEDLATQRITALNDLRVHIPATLGMFWDVSDTTAVIGGTASAKVSLTVTFENGGKTLVLDVLTDFDDGETVIVSGLAFTTFTGASFDSLTLEVNGAGNVCAGDDKTIRIGTRPTILSAVTGDVNGNGSLDRLVVTFSEDLDGLSAGITQGLGFTLAGYNIVFGVESLPGVVTFFLTESGIPDTGATPNLSYDPVLGDLLDADQGLEPIDYGPVAATDGAPPRLVGFAFNDSDSDGLINNLVFTFSEALAPGQEDLSDWAVVDGNGTANLLLGLTDAAVVIAGNQVTITLADTTGTNGLPRYRFLQDGSGGALRDLVGLLVPAASNNTPPVARAGSDTVLVPTIVTINASASTDIDGQLLTYSWAQIGGPPVILNTPGAAITSFTAIASGVYTFEITVSDGLSQSTDTVTVTIQDVPPSASAGVDQTVTAGATVTLDGRGSFDTNGDVVSYLWEQTAGTAVVIDATVPDRPTFPTAGLNEVLVFRLTASDPSGKTDTDLVIVRVNAAGNSVPTADAGGDLTIEVGGTLTLDGRRSSDPDGDPLTFAWSPASLVAFPTASTTTFAPTVPGIYVFTLTVRDDSLVFGVPDEVRVTVLPAGATNRPPTPSVTVSPSAAVALETNVVLDASGSVDPDGQTVRFAWTQIGGPIVFFTNPAAAAPGFSAVLAGTYVFQLVVSDGTLEAAPVFVTVQVLPPLAFPPTALIFIDPSDDPEGDARVSSADAPITIRGSSSLGAGLSYAWTQVSGPAVALVNATSADMSFSPFAAGVYRFTLLIRDVNGLLDAKTIDVVVDTPANLSPTAIAGPDQSRPADTMVTLDGTASSDPADSDGVTSFGTGLLAFWRQVAGPTVVLSDPIASRPTFQPTKVGHYTFELVVSDGVATSLADTVTVAVTTAVSSGSGGGSGGRRCGLTGLEILLLLAALAWLRRLYMGWVAAR